jgi:tRNA(Ser,Leu) C12 N-acetylase TAN1
MKIEDVKMKWTSGAACPEGITLEKVYYVIKKNGKLYFSDGGLEVEISENALKNIFTPVNGVKWEDVVFVEEVKGNKQNK